MASPISPTVLCKKFPYCVQPLLDNNPSHSAIVHTTENGERKVHVVLHHCKISPSLIPGVTQYLCAPLAQEMRVIYIDCSFHKDIQNIIENLHKSGFVCRCELKDRAHQLETKPQYSVFFSYGQDGLEEVLRF